MHVTDGDVIEGQRVNSGVRLHEKPRAPSRQIRGGRNDRFIILKRRLSYTSFSWYRVSILKLCKAYYLIYYTIIYPFFQSNINYLYPFVNIPTFLKYENEIIYMIVGNM